MLRDLGRRGLGRNVRGRAVVPGRFLFQGEVW